MALRRKAILETPNRKRRKRKKIIQYAIGALVLFAAVSWGVVALFRLQSLQVTTLSIGGTKEVDEATLRNEIAAVTEGAYFYVIPKRFFFFYPKKQVAAALLSAHKEIHFAEVKTDGLTAASVTVSERTPEALYCVASCFYLDAEGFVYRIASSSEEYLTFRDLRPLDQTASPIGTSPLVFPPKGNIFKDVKDFSQKLQTTNMHLIAIVIQSDGDLRAETQEGTLLISAKEPLSDQFEFLKTALSQKIFKASDDSVRTFGYIDLRFGKKIFYRLEGAPIAASSTATSSAATSTIVQ